MMEQKIELGDRVKDPISGKTGIVVMLGISLQGCNQAGVTFPSKDENYSPSNVYMFDRPQLEIVKKGVIKPNKKHDQPAIELGDLCEDLITKIKGVATYREVYLYRCDRISVQPQSKDKRTVEDAFSVDAMTLKVLKKGHVTLKETSEPQNNVGCAMTRISRK
jgi:hypothetical protein